MNIEPLGGNINIYFPGGGKIFPEAEGYFRSIDIDIDDTFMSKYRKRYRRYFCDRFFRYFDIDAFELI